MSPTVSKRSKGLALAAVGEGLAVLGDKSVIDAFYDCLQKKQKIMKDEIIYNLDAFHTFLEDLFGGGAKTIEKRIARSLYRKLGLPFVEQADWNLTQYIEKTSVNDN